jgi:aspartyl-tRNA(Asn)/glutamyl-tRNA(Gln) amidotransferase subunit C
MITKTDVEKAAALARLRLDDNEVARIAADLARVTGYVEQLMAVDVGAVEPMVQPFVDEAAPRRADEAREVIGRKALEGSRGYEDGLVRVPVVVE